MTPAAFTGRDLRAHADALAAEAGRIEVRLAKVLDGREFVAAIQAYVTPRTQAAEALRIAADRLAAIPFAIVTSPEDDPTN